VAARAARRRLALPPETLRHLAATHPGYFPVLLDSAALDPRGNAETRTLLAAAPCAFLALDQFNRLHASGDVPHGIAAMGGREGGFLAALERWWHIVHREEPDNRSLAGGWIVYLGYEMAQEIEPGLQLPPGRLPWRAMALRVGGALIHDIRAGTVDLEAAAGSGGDTLLDEIAGHIDQAKGTPAPVAGRVPMQSTLREEPAEHFLARVAMAQEHIRAGNIYQANLSRWWRAEWDGASGPLYERLRIANPAPFAAYAHFPGMEILSSSPERLLSIHRRVAGTRPIAGTRPRSLQPGEDEREREGLAAHPKERAEHVMLIDLERNDLGRVCEAGSVRVDEFMAVESYAHVHHIVSSVSGRLRPGVTPIGALRAVFPGGTITGVPKVRCMQIIAALEGEGRDAYTGSLGWLSPAGDADFNILIRTLALAGGQVEARAGAGIVADSSPQRELEETRAKARGLLAALGGQL
jgi:anthranilate synthase component 1